MTRADKKLTRIQVHNQDKILSAALTIFSSYGYRGTTVDQIAAMAGMSKANLLYYFRRKEDIYLAVLGHTLEEWLQPLQTLNPDGDPAEELWLYTKQKLVLSRSKPEASRLFANEILQGAPMISPFLSGDLRTLVNQKCAVLEGWIREKKMIDVDPIHLLFVIWASTQHYADFRTQINALVDSSDDELFAAAEKTLKAIILGLVTSK